MSELNPEAAAFIRSMMNKRLIRQRADGSYVVTPAGQRAAKEYRGEDQWAE